MELQGTLKDFSLETIFDLVRNGHKTGRLHLALIAPNGAARDVAISFLGGELMTALCGSLHGLDALREASLCEEGSFEFAVDESVANEQPTEALTAETVLEAIRSARAEAGSLGAAFVSTDLPLRHAFPTFDTITISPQEFSLLAVLHDGMTIREVMSASPLSTIDAIRIMRRLLDRGLLTTAHPPALDAPGS